MSSDTLHDLPGFARGFVLAHTWAEAQGAPRAPGAGDRITPLHPRAIDEVLERVAALGIDELAGIRGEWLVSEPERRLEPELDLHWSWLPEALEGEAPALLVLLLHSDRARRRRREVLRALWPRLRNVPSKELEASAPSEAWMAAVRRHFLTRFALISADGPRGSRRCFTSPAASCTSCCRRPARPRSRWREATTCRARSNRGSTSSRASTPRARRLLKEARDRGEAATSPAVTFLGPRRRRGGQGGSRGWVALDHLGALRAARGVDLLRAAPAARAGRWLPTRRDSWGAEEALEIEPLRAEQLQRIATVVSRSAVPTVANRVYLGGHQGESEEPGWMERC
ncbi:MAG: hypothetical protein U0527_10695 [Candidatus Eisenbacteria bacterium]